MTWLASYPQAPYTEGITEMSNLGEMNLAKDNKKRKRPKKSPSPIRKLPKFEEPKDPDVEGPGAVGV